MNIRHTKLASALLLGLALTLLGFSTGCNSGSREHDEWIRAAEVDYKAARYDDAIGRMTRLIELSKDKPTICRAYYTRGLCYAKTGQRSAAYSDMKQAVKVQDTPDVTWRAFVVLGSLYFEDSRWDSAEKALAAALKRMKSPDPIDEVLFKLGQCYERLGRWQDAREPFERLVREFPKSRFHDDARRRLSINATHFAIQCGVFSTRNSADQLAGQLRSKGLDAYVKREPRGGRELNVVLVGKYARYEDLWRDVTRVRSYVPSAVLWP
jgi:tetratricopeptide (TPR) repeat protein